MTQQKPLHTHSTPHAGDDRAECLHSHHCSDNATHLVRVSHHNRPGKPLPLCSNGVDETIDRFMNDHTRTLHITAIEEKP